MKISQGNCGNYADQQHCDSNRVELNAAFSANKVTVSEISQFGSGQISGRTRVTSGRFARTNHALMVNSHASQIRFVNRSGVIPAGRWGRPSVNSFFPNQNRHCEFGINSFNSLPSSSDGQKWVNDRDAFIKQHNFWTSENQISHTRNSDSPNDSCDQFTLISPNKDRDSHHDAHDVNHQRHNQIASRSENLNVCHSAILAQFTRTAA